MLDRAQLESLIRRLSRLRSDYAAGGRVLMPKSERISALTDTINALEALAAASQALRKECDDVIAENGRLIAESARLLEEALAARKVGPPSVLQRIAALTPWEYCGVYDDERCFFCGVDRELIEHPTGRDHEANCIWWLATQGGEPKEDPAPSGWQPIADAPKDGTLIDVWLGDAEPDEVDFYCTPGTRRSCGWSWRQGRFRPTTGLHVLVVTVKPTHFMLLPSSPVEARGLPGPVSGEEPQPVVNLMDALRRGLENAYPDLKKSEEPPDYEPESAGDPNDLRMAIRRGIAKARPNPPKETR